MDKENRVIGAVVAVIAYILSLVVLSQMGMSFSALNTVIASFGGFLLSVFLGVWVYDLSMDYLVEKVSIAGSMSVIVGLLVAFLVLPQISAGFADTLNFGAAQTEVPPAEKPAFPSYMRGSVVNALSSPTVAISGAEINFYDTKPMAGVGKVALYTDNTDPSGSFMTEVKETEDTHLWATASKDGYYAEEDDGLTGESGSGATNLTFNDHANGLTKIGTLSKRIINAQPADNINLVSGNVVLDNAASDTFTFDLVLEDSASATAIRNLYASLDDGDAYDNELIEMEIPTAENPEYGTLSANVVSGKLAWGNGINSTEIQMNGDLQYRKDLVIHFRITSDDGTTGTIIDVEDMNDLSGQVGLESGTGIANQPFAVKNNG